MSDPENLFRRRAPLVDEATFVCALGDYLIVHTSATTEEGDIVEIGSQYEVVGRKAYGWDLRLDRGGGAPLVRVLNSKVLSHFAHAGATNA